MEKINRKTSLHLQTFTSIHNRSYAPEVRVTVVVVVVAGVGIALAVGIVALVIPPPGTPLCFFNTLFSGLSLFPPLLESVPRVSSPPPFLREGSVRLRVTPTVVLLGGVSEFVESGSNSNEKKKKKTKVRERHQRPNKSKDKTKKSHHSYPQLSVSSSIWSLSLL